MKSNELLSNQAYLPRRNFMSPPSLRLRHLAAESRSPDVTSRNYNQSKEFDALERNIRNTLTVRLQGEFDEILHSTQRDNNNLREQNDQLRSRLAQYENKITGLHTQLEIKKAIREGKKVNFKALPKRQGETLQQQFQRAADVYENEIKHWRDLYESQLKKSEEMKMQLTKVDTQLDTLVCDYLTDGQQ